LEAQNASWRLRIQPWRLKIQPWRLKKQPWELKMQPWRLKTQPGRLKNASLEAQKCSLGGSADKRSPSRITLMEIRIRIKVKILIGMRIKVKSWICMDSHRYCGSATLVEEGQQRVLNDLQRARHSRGRMIWLLDYPLPSVSSIATPRKTKRR
jgi:hypothetical protein